MVAAAASNERLASSRCHEANPSRLLRSPGLVEVSELADVMDFGICCGAAELAVSGEQTFYQLAAPGPVLLCWRAVGEDCMRLSFERDAAEARNQRLSSSIALDEDLDAPAWSVRSLNSGGMFASDLRERGLVLDGQCLEQRRLHYPLELAETKHILGECEVLDVSSKLALVPGDDREVVVMSEKRSSLGLAPLHVAGTLLVDRRFRHEQTDDTIHRPLSTAIEFVVGMLGSDLIAEESGGGSRGVSDHCLGIRQGQTEFIS